jgi:hypothetical protein
LARSARICSRSFSCPACAIDEGTEIAAAPVDTLVISHLFSIHQRRLTTKANVMRTQDGYPIPVSGYVQVLPSIRQEVLRVSTHAQSAGQGSTEEYGWLPIRDSYSLRRHLRVGHFNRQDCVHLKQICGPAAHDNACWSST